MIPVAEAHPADVDDLRACALDDVQLAALASRGSLPARAVLAERSLAWADEAWRRFEQRIAGKIAEAERLLARTA